QAVNQMLALFFCLNLFLAFFNLIPFHPLDGGKILARFLPETLNRQIEDNSMIFSVVLIVLAFSGGLAFIAYPVFWFERSLFNFALTVVGA
ncbi:MAG: site-2 protease family protein, partial [Bdellovibrionales bacterium]|nr:site-2 protease family protein [Bdellovibrionales bacterium]